MIFILLALCFWLLKDAPYELPIKIILFIFLLVVLVTNSYMYFKGKRNNPDKATLQESKINSIMLLIALGVSPLIAFLQFKF